MATFKGNNLYVHDSGLKTGILITNLGTPDEPTKSSLKTYLKQFLSDERTNGQTTTISFNRFLQSFLPNLRFSRKSCYNVGRFAAIMYAVFTSTTPPERN